MKQEKLWSLKKGAKLRAVKPVEAATADGDKVIAKPGDIGHVEEPGGKDSRWPTVRFPGGASIVFDDEVELAS